MRALALAASVVVLGLTTAGCVTMGTKFDPAAVSTLRPGVSTEADAISVLGRPNAEVHGPNGHVLLTWLWSRGTAFGTGTANSVGIAFDETGKMIRVVQTSHVDTR